MLTGVFLPDLLRQAERLADWTARIGRAPDMLLAFSDGQPDWHHLGNIGWLTEDMAVTRLPVCWSMPMLPANGDRLDIAASGACDPYYYAAAKHLAAYPHKRPDGTQLIRIGWEFTSGYPWQVQVVPQNTPIAYVDVWRRIVAYFRVVSPEFRFVWCGNSGNQVWGGGSPGYCYPGDDYVDVIACDAYQNARAGCASFSDQLGWCGWGVQWWYDFAQCLQGLRVGHPKPFGLGEWGVTNGGKYGSDAQGAAYIMDLGAWLQGRNVEYHCFWNGDAGSGYDSMIDDGSKPLCLTAFKAAFATPGAPPAR